MAHEGWTAINDLLNRTADAGREVEIWLRDDDAIAETAELHRLSALCATYGMPVLLAVIPKHAEPGLAAFVATQPLLTPTQHGFSHRNHARPGEKARELGEAHPEDAIIADLQRGRDKLDLMFGSRMTDILVPPWNRIDAHLLPRLPAIGFGAVSTFGPPRHQVPGLDILNCDLDLIDWRNGRRAHGEEKLTKVLSESIERHGRVGLLAHHLAHDEAAWAFLDDALGRLASHPAVRFVAADAIRKARSVPRSDLSGSCSCAAPQPAHGSSARGDPPEPA